MPRCDRCGRRDPSVQRHIVMSGMYSFLCPDCARRSSPQMMAHDLVEGYYDERWEAQTMRKELEARTDVLLMTLDGARCEVPWGMAEGLADTLEGDCYEWELYRRLYIVNVGDQVSVQPEGADAALLPREEAVSLAGGVRKMMASYEAWRQSQ